mmetsp:Transcript_32237/g.35866  ORF Transcript_32237/g.35866 Transcript_32237/m.35866 type:complete len:87 (+) Transcript_32237:323-583(+)
MTQTGQQRTKQRSAEKCLPSFISHPNGIVLRVFKQKQGNYAASGKKRRSPAAVEESTALVDSLDESIPDIEMKTETETDQRLAGAK